jgi:hypothetical protein
MNAHSASELNDLFTIDCKDISLRGYRIEDLEELYALTQQSEILSTKGKTLMIKASSENDTPLCPLFD